jgi:hypothetical protein
MWDGVRNVGATAGWRDGGAGRGVRDAEGAWRLIRLFAARPIVTGDGIWHPFLERVSPACAVMVPPEQ